MISLAAVKRLVVCEELERSNCGNILFYCHLSPPGQSPLSSHRQADVCFFTICYVGRRDPFELFLDSVAVLVPSLNVLEEGIANLEPRPSTQFFFCSRGKNHCVEGLDSRLGYSLCGLASFPGLHPAFVACSTKSFAGIESPGKEATYDE